MATQARGSIPISMRAGNGRPWSGCPEGVRGRSDTGGVRGCRSGSGGPVSKAARVRSLTNRGMSRTCWPPAPSASIPKRGTSRSPSSCTFLSARPTRRARRTASGSICTKVRWKTPRGSTLPRRSATWIMPPAGCGEPSGRKASTKRRSSSFSATTADRAAATGSGDGVPPSVDGWNQWAVIAGQAQPEERTMYWADSKSQAVRRAHGS